MPLKEPHVFGATDTLLLVADFNKLEKTITITALRTSDGSLINSIEFTDCELAYDFKCATAHFVGHDRVIVVLPSLIVLISVSSDDHIKLEDTISHNGDIFLTSCFGYNFLVVESHPPQYFYGRVESNILFIQLLNNRLQLIRTWEHAPSCSSMAIDDNLDLYLVVTQPDLHLAKFSLS
jgi:hypothetical protein